MDAQSAAVEPSEGARPINPIGALLLDEADRLAVLESHGPDTLLDDPELKAAYDAWAKSRSTFIDDLHVEGSEAQKKKWQKEYFRGESSGANKPNNHRTKLRVRPFK